MPRLLLFVPCEKAIVAQEDNLLSAVSILERINTQVPAGLTLPADAAAPLRWSIALLWRSAPEEVGKKYEVRLQIIHPSGTQPVDSINDLEIVDTAQHVIITVEGFSVGEEGDHTVRLSIREPGYSKRWRTLVEYPIAVTHVPIPAVATPAQ